MASAGDENNRPRQAPAGQTRHMIRIPLPRGIQPGQRITIRYAQPAPGQGGQRPQIRVIQLPVRPQQQQQSGGRRGGGGGGGDVSRALREQEEAARRAAEENHRRTQLWTALSTIQPPLVEFKEDEGVVRVSWQPVEVAGGDEVEYVVKGWKDGAGEPVVIYQGQLTSCVATTETLSRGHTHQVAVSACASRETGDPSQRVEVEVPALAPEQPPPPKIFSRTKNSLGLRWNAPAANGSPITEYSLEWDQSTGEYKEVYRGKKKEFKFSQKLPPGSQSLFRVRAKNAVGWSDFSEDTVHNVGQASPPAPPPPSLSSHTSTSLTLRWATPPGSGSVTSYCLEMDDPNSGYGFCPVYQGDGLSYTCRGLQRVTVYNFRLSALNEAGSSPYSSPVAFTTSSEPPGCPGDICLGSRPSSTSLRLEWSPPTNDGGSSVESYILQVDDGNGGELRDVYKGSEVNFQLDSLSPGKSYRCRVCAVSSGGQGAWSNEAQFKTPPTLPHPPMSVGVQGKVTVSSAIISWRRPSSDGGSAITSYSVQLRESWGEWETVGTVAEQLSFSSPAARSSSLLRHTLTNLTPGTHCTVRVNCRNAVGTSEWSECASFSTAPGPPAPPDDLSLTSITAHSAKLHWKESLEYGSEVSGYEVEWGPVGGARHVMPLPPSPCVASLTHLSPNTSHTARVKAVSETGHSEWSSSLSFTTSPSTPSPPSHLALVSATPNSILVAWSVPPSPGSPLSHYHVHLLPAPPTSDSSHLVIPPSETQATLQNLKPNTQYTVRVQAENGVGLGQLSSPLPVSTLPPPPPPPSLSLISCTSNSLRLAWGKKASKSISYTLQLATGSGRFHTTYTGTGVGHRLQRLTPATHYSLRIAASSDSGQGAWSDLLTCETLPTGPSAPLDLVMRWEDDVIVMSWEKVSHPLPVTYELQLKIGGQDFTQVYRGSAPSYTHTVTNHTHHQARVRVFASCHANNRMEQLFSGFSAVSSCDCSATPTSVDHTPPSSPNDTTDTVETTGAPQDNEGVWSRPWLMPLLFVGVSVLVVVIAILLGKLFVSSQKM